MESRPQRTLSVVVPIYQGATTIEGLVEELVALPFPADSGLSLIEIVLVHDGAVDDSARELIALEARHDRVQVIWLSRNFGQHPATVAGIAATTGDWVVTMDEDGLHDPAVIHRLIATAEGQGHDLVYACPANTVPHAWHRNLTSRMAKSIVGRVLDSGNPASFASFRLIDGTIARSMAAYYGPGVYLDVALSWVVQSAGTLPVQYRREGRDNSTSGYNIRRLLSHFRRLVVTSGMKPLRLASLIGLIALVLGLGIAVVAITMRLTNQVAVPGWASITALVAVSSGLILLVLGVLAEYLAMAIDMASGRPPYLSLSRPPLRAMSDSTAPTVTASGPPTPGQSADRRASETIPPIAVEQSHG